MKIIYFQFFMLLLASLECAGDDSPGESAPWPERFRKEAPLSWRRYSAWAERLQGSVLVNNETTAPSKAILWKGSCEFQQRAGFAKFQEQHEYWSRELDTTGSIAVVNPRYGFLLKRGTPDAPWTVAEVDTTLGENSKYLGRGSPGEQIRFYTTCPFTFRIMCKTLGLIPLESGFTTKEVTPLIRAGRELVKVEFEYEPPANAFRTPAASGWVVYDPAHFWVLNEYNVILNWRENGLDDHRSGSLEYELAEGGYPIPKSAIGDSYVAKQEYRTSSHLTFQLAQKDIPESEFTLTAFGFPEPTRRHPALWFLYAIVAGLACLALSAWLRRKSRAASPA